MNEQSEQSVSESGSSGRRGGPSEDAVRLAEHKRAALGRIVDKRRSRTRTSNWSDENKARVMRAEHALRHYLKGGQRPTVAVRDILSDLRHYCDACGVSYSKQDEIADRNYVGQVLELI